MNDNNTTRGRNQLRAWEDNKPKNFFAADHNLQAVLRMYLGDAAYAAAEDNWQRFGGEVATIIDEAFNKYLGWSTYFHK